MILALIYLATLCAAIGGVTASPTHTIGGTFWSAVVIVNYAAGIALAVSAL